jgi:hypothetical protein
MTYDTISDLITTKLVDIENATGEFIAGCDSVNSTLRQFVTTTEMAALDAKAFVKFLKKQEDKLETIKAAIPVAVGALDDIRPHYTPDPEPDVAHIYEEATGWRRFVPGMKLKKTTVIENAVVPRQRSVSLQTAFLNAKAWNNQLIQSILVVADQLELTTEHLEDQLVDIKEVAVSADKQLANGSEKTEARSLLARRLYMEEVAKTVREHLVSISLHKREFSVLATSVRKGMDTLPEEDFFNVKSEEDVERFIVEAQARRAS